MPDPSRQERDLAAAFLARYGRSPQLVARAPGRVNLIGEHTDYSGLPVLPVAIDREVLIAAAPGQEAVVELDSLALPSPMSWAAPPPVGETRSWHRYLAGSLAEIGTFRGAQLLIGGDLPYGGGLSSSSALTVGLLAALNEIWRLGWDRSALIQAAVRAERRTGMEGGEMDQTVIVLGRPATALRIDFQPTRTRHVVLPEGLAMAVAYSGSEASKSTAVDRYNTLVVAGRAAALLLERAAGIDAGAPPRLAPFVAAPGLEAAVADLPEWASATWVADQVSVGDDAMVSLTDGRFDRSAPLPVRSFAEHVFGETRRVEETEKALRSGDLRSFGELLDESHTSLGALGVSTAGLDRAVAAMRLSGAYGSRLTGAGFGGYALAVCSPDRLPGVVRAAARATGGPAFAVEASAGLSVRSL